MNARSGTLFEKRSDLDKFIAVAETGKLVAAADRLTISQPALTRAIARLENRFGGQLFERLPTGVRLTPLGTIAADLVRHVLREIVAAEEKIVEARSGRAGSFRVTAGPVWMDAVLPAAITRFGDSCSGIELRLRTATRPEGLRSLMAGESDLHCGGIDAGDLLPPFLKRDSFMRVEAGIVAHRDHPLHKGIGALDDLAACPWIDYGGNEPVTADRAAPPSLSGVLDALYERTGKRVKTVVRAGTGGLALLATGLWLSWLPLPFLDRKEAPEIRPLSVELGRHDYRTGLIARRAAQDLPPFRLLVAAVRDAALKRRTPPAG